MRDLELKFFQLLAYDSKFVYLPASGEVKIS